jgi:dienelactone hydrolase
MRFGRWVAGAGIALAWTGLAAAAPMDPLPDGDNPLGYDCLRYRWVDGSGNPADPAPGTPAWTERDRENQYCSTQRYVDRSFQPMGDTAPTWGQDPYRIPNLPGNAGTRFRFDTPPIPGIGTASAGLPAAEVYRPCPATGPEQCAGVPAGVAVVDPPYPVVVVFHGFTASMQLHRWTTEVLAEAGYMAIGVNGTWPYPVSAPNSQTPANGTAILAWLASADGQAMGADPNRVGFAGHSQGGAAILSFQGDRRVTAMVDWDGGTTSAAANTFQPIMYQGEDGIAFTFSPPTASNANGTAATTPQAASGYTDLRGRNVDTMGLSFRAWTHTDYNGNGGPAGNRSAELTSNYFTLAWFDRYLKGKLALDGAGSVLTSGGRTEAEERAYRQALAEDAYDRLRVTPAKTFDASVDVHNISMGFWDPVKAATSPGADPGLGGNVTYALEGTPIWWRLSFYAPSVCFLSVPNYVGGGDVSFGGSGSDIAARADSTVAGDMRLEGCPEVTP